MQPLILSRHHAPPPRPAVPKEKSKAKKSDAAPGEDDELVEEASDADGKASDDEDDEAYDPSKDKAEGSSSAKAKEKTEKALSDEKALVYLFCFGVMGGGAKEK